MHLCKFKLHLYVYMCVCVSGIAILTATINIFTHKNNKTTWGRNYLKSLNNCLGAQRRFVYRKHQILNASMNLAVNQAKYSVVSACRGGK